tara:strand:- start:63 stop:182 length:120 start_codon:yes stop_codon:yes gene_type:complete
MSEMKKVNQDHGRHSFLDEIGSQKYSDPEKKNNITQNST